MPSITFPSHSLQTRPPFAALNTAGRSLSPTYYALKYLRRLSVDRQSFQFKYVADQPIGEYAD